MDCVDAVAKKAAFIQQAAAELELPNLRGVHARVENLSGPVRRDQLPGLRLAGRFRRLVVGGAGRAGRLAGDEGQAPDEEIAALPPTVEVFHVEQLEVPGLDAERCIVWMQTR